MSSQKVEASLPSGFEVSVQWRGTKEDVPFFKMGPLRIYSAAILGDDAHTPSQYLSAHSSAHKAQNLMTLLAFGEWCHIMDPRYKKAIKTESKSPLPTDRSVAALLEGGSFGFKPISGLTLTSHTPSSDLVSSFSRFEQPSLSHDALSAGPAE